MRLFKENPVHVKIANDFLYCTKFSDHEMKNEERRYISKTGN